MTARHRTDGGRGATDENRRTASTSRRTFLRTVGAGAVATAVGGSALGTAAGGVPTPPLSTDGKWIVDPMGNHVKLRGVATADPGFYRRSWHPKSWEAVIRHATDESRGWHPNHVRLPITKSSIDFHSSASAFSDRVADFVEQTLRPAVDLCAARDVYAMVDFHLIRPYTQAATEEANQSRESPYAPIDDVLRGFWSVVAPEFAEDDNVIFELFNEPTRPAGYGTDDATTWGKWKTAAQPWVDLVKANAPARPLIVGSPDWTSYTHMGARDPFEGEDLIYSGHIYPANGYPHEQGPDGNGPFDATYGQPADEVPVVITEFGWDPSGTRIDQGTSSGFGTRFKQWAQSYTNLGWTAWCFDDSWAPTMFSSPNSGAATPWTLKDGPEQHGGFIKTWLDERKDYLNPAQTIDDSQAPPAPGNLRATEVAGSHVAIDWDAVEDVGSAGLQAYRVTVDGTQATELLADVTETTLTGLETDTTYTIGVTAVDGVGNVSEAATVEVTTKGADEGQRPYGTNVVPGRIQAEDFDVGGAGVAYSDTTLANQGGSSYRDTGVDLTTTDANTYVSYVQTGEWLEYTLDVREAGQHVLQVNVATNNNQGGNLRFTLDGDELATQNVWPTNGWESWKTIRVGPVDLSTGEQTLRLTATSGGFNINWIQLAPSGWSPGDPTPTPPAETPTATETPTSTAQGPGWPTDPAATDPDDDGFYEDLTGNGEIDNQDVVTFFQNMGTQSNPGPMSEDGNLAYYDFSGNDAIDYQDLIALFGEI